MVDMAHKLSGSLKMLFIISPLEVLSVVVIFQELSWWGKNKNKLY